MDAAEELPLRIGVALSAGSAAAMSQIGVLEALTDAGIPIHSVAGTSAGAIVGAAFAAGRVSDLREHLASLSRARVFGLFDLAWSREGFLHGRRALELIRPHLGERIETLDLPYAAVATDLRNGEEVTLTRGPVFDAVRASIAIPGIFTPWRVDGRILVDGGLVNPLPVSTVQALGAEFVIAVNVLPLREKRKRPVSLRDHLRLIRSDDTAAPADSEEASGEGFDEELGIVDVVWRASRILASQVATTRLREDRPDLLVQIPVSEVGMFDLHRTQELADLGRRCAEELLPSLHRALDGAVPWRRRLQNWSRRVIPFR